MSKSARVLLGRITGVHGLKGEVVVHAYTEHAEDVAAYGTVSDGEGLREVELKIVRVTDKGIIARVPGVRDRTQAEALKGMELWVPRERLPDVEDGEFYHADLIGLAVVAPDGAALGTVVAVQNYGASDLLEIRMEGSRRTELVAFTDDFVPEVDIAGGRVVVLMSGGGEPPPTEDGTAEDDDDTEGKGI
ncbi:MAG: ribosome maturation factor RimM [Hyphomicrobiaceae bacterium]